MRRYLALALGVAVALSVAGIALAAPNDTSTVKAKFTPSKLPKKKFKSGSLAVETTTVYPTGGGTPTAPTKKPEPTTHVKLDFDDDFKFNPGSIPQCKVTDQQLATAGNNDDAKAMCGAKSVVGSGSGVVCVAGNTGDPCGQVGTAQVTAFNGKPKNNKPTIYLYSHASQNVGGAVVVLVGTLVKSPLGGDFGKRLDVPVPLIASGLAAITDFKTTVQNGRYVQARCHDGNHKLNVKATFQYNDNAVDHVATSQRCKVKR